jgi:hypothetical protein
VLQTKLWKGDMGCIGQGRFVNQPLLLGCQLGFALSKLTPHAFPYIRGRAGRHPKDTPHENPFPGLHNGGGEETQESMKKEEKKQGKRLGISSCFFFFEFTCILLFSCKAFVWYRLSTAFLSLAPPLDKLVHTSPVTGEPVGVIFKTRHGSKESEHAWMDVSFAQLFNWFLPLNHTTDRAELLSSVLRCSVCTQRKTMHLVYVWASRRADKVGKCCHLLDRDIQRFGQTVTGKKILEEWDTEMCHDPTLVQRFNEQAPFQTNVLDVDDADAFVAGLKQARVRFPHYFNSLRHNFIQSHLHTIMTQLAVDPSELTGGIWKKKPRLSPDAGVHTIPGLNTARCKIPDPNLAPPARTLSDSNAIPPARTLPEPSAIPPARTLPEPSAIPPARTLPEPSAIPPARTLSDSNAIPPARTLPEPNATPLARTLPEPNVAPLPVARIHPGTQFEMKGTTWTSAFSDVSTSAPPYSLHGATVTENKGTNKKGQWSKVHLLDIDTTTLPLHAKRVRKKKRRAAKKQLHSNLSKACAIMLKAHSAIYGAPAKETEAPLESKTPLGSDFSLSQPLVSTDNLSSTESKDMEPKGVGHKPLKSKRKNRILAKDSDNDASKLPKEEILQPKETKSAETTGEDKDGFTNASTHADAAEIPRVEHPSVHVLPFPKPQESTCPKHPESPPPLPQPRESTPPLPQPRESTLPLPQPRESTPPLPQPLEPTSTPLQPLTSKGSESTPHKPRGFTPTLPSTPSCHTLKPPGGNASTESKSSRGNASTESKSSRGNASTESKPSKGNAPAESKPQRENAPAESKPQRENATAEPKPSKGNTPTESKSPFPASQPNPSPLYPKPLARSSPPSMDRVRSKVPNAENWKIVSSKGERQTRRHPTERRWERSPLLSRSLEEFPALTKEPLKNSVGSLTSVASHRILPKEDASPSEKPEKHKASCPVIEPDSKPPNEAAPNPPDTPQSSDSPALECKKDTTGSVQGLLTKASETRDQAPLAKGPPESFQEVALSPIVPVYPNAGHAWTTPTESSKAVQGG